MSHLDDLHALLSERAHLRAQRDELQRDCTRFEAEARAAREEVRRLRAMHTPAAIPSQPKCEDKPTFVATWKRHDYAPWFVLITPEGRDAGMLERWPGGSYAFRAKVGETEFYFDDGIECACHAEQEAQDLGWIPAGMVDRRVLREDVAPEEKPAYVARWRRCQSVDGWFQLIETACPMTVLAYMTRVPWKGERITFRSTVGAHTFDSFNNNRCARMAESHLRSTGRLPLGPIDRSALE